MKLSATQTKAIDYLTDKESKEVLYGGGAGSGKSFLGAYWILKSAIKYPNTRWLIGRAVAKTLRDTTLKTFWMVCKEQEIRADIHYKYIWPSMIVFKNGSEVILKDLFQYPSDPDFDELGSLEITGAFIDEANQVTHKAKSIVRSRIRYGLDEYGLIPKSLYTCNPAHNWVKSEFRDPFIQGTLDKSKKFVQALLKDNPYITPHYKENLMSLEKRDRDRLLYGHWDYDEDPAMLMAFANIEALFTNSHIEPSGQKYMAIDVARFGKDKTVIRIWHGYVCIKRIALDQSSITEVGNLIKRLSKEYQVPVSNIVIDEDGIGGGVVDQLPGCKGFIANARPINMKQNEKYDSLKAQCCYKLAELINNKLMYEPMETHQIKEKLTEDLQHIKDKGIDKDGTRGIMSKDKVKEALGRSPDDGDTYVMRMMFELRSNYGEYENINRYKPALKRVPVHKF
jgi:phage terminase large subunit